MQKRTSPLKSGHLAEKSKEDTVRYEPYSATKGTAPLFRRSVCESQTQCFGSCPDQKDIFRDRQHVYIILENESSKVSLDERGQGWGES